MSEDKRVVTTDIQLDNPTVRGGQLFGVKCVLAFTVSMNADDKKAGEFTQIENVTVDFNGAIFQNVIANAMANRKVQWQGPMRDNMDKIETLSNSTVMFADVPFGKAKTKSVPVTEESALAFIQALPPEKQAEAVAKLLAALKVTEEPEGLEELA